MRHSPHSLRRERREEGATSSRLEQLWLKEKSFLVAGTAPDTYVRRCSHTEVLERAPAKRPCVRLACARSAEPDVFRHGKAQPPALLDCSARTTAQCMTRGSSCSQPESHVHSDRKSRCHDLRRIDQRAGHVTSTPKSCCTAGTEIHTDANLATSQQTTEVACLDKELTEARSHHPSVRHKLCPPLTCPRALRQATERVPVARTSPRESESVSQLPTNAARELCP